MIRTESAAPFDSFFSPRRFALLLALLIVACFAPVLFGFQSFVFRDFGLFGHPLAYYHRESFWRGEIPLWNPLNNCGLPFMAQWNTMVFYPPSLIYLLLPLPWSLCLFCLLHLYFGGLGMFFLARRWTGSNFAAAFAGIIFSFNGLALHCLMWPNNSAALAWMPWILLLLERACARGGWALLPAILAGACQFMAGAPEAFLLTWVGAAVLWLAQVVTNRTEMTKYVFRFVAVVAGIVALSSVQLFPLLELIKHSQRSAGYDTGGWAMPPWGWANLLVPLFRTTSGGGVAYQIGQAWTSSYYFGVATIWLALLAPVRVRSERVWTLALLVLAALVLALGDAGFVWPWIKNHVGALGFMRYPIKLIFLAACPLTLLAAFGLAELIRRWESSSPLRREKILLGLLLALCFIVWWFAWQHPLANENARAAISNGFCRAIFFVALVGGLWLLRKVSENRARAVAIVWLLVLAADLLTHMPWQNPTVAASLLAPKLGALQALRQAAPPSEARVMPSLEAIGWFHQSPATNLASGYLARRLGASHNLNLLDDIAKPDGFFSLYLANEQDVQARLFRDENHVREPIADVMSIAQMTAPGKLFEWSARKNYLPIVSAGQQPVFLPAPQILDAMLRDDFDPHATVFLPLDVKTNVSAARQAEAKVFVEKFQPQEIQLKVTTPAAAIVTISQSFYPAWKARVDGVLTPLLAANHAFQAVQVPAGTHRLELRYEDRMFRMGALISGPLFFLIALSFAAFPNCRRAFLGAE